MAGWRMHILGLCLFLGFIQANLAGAVSADGGPVLPALTFGADGSEPAKVVSTLPRVFSKPIPENVRDLKEIQSHVQKLVVKVLPTTVGLRVGTAQGSGVIISKDGYILTAAHVSGKADQIAEIVLHDGRKVRGKTLGANQLLDSGLIKIEGPGPWEHADMAQCAELRQGHWCLALGHPLGYQEGRPPVARLGRVLECERSFIRTDCPLVGGDSGGPLFDMHGLVIGIHSRIGPHMTANVHVPADTFRETWNRLTKGEIWGPNLFANELGLRLDPKGRVTLVAPYSSAEKAGIKINDMLLLFDGRKLAHSEELDYLLHEKASGSEVTLQMRRGDAILTFKMTVQRMK